MKTRIYHYIASILFAVILSSATTFAQTAATVTEHTVQRGESLESIASKYNVTPQAILDANPTIKTIFTGIKLTIPAPTAQPLQQTATGIQQTQQEAASSDNAANENTADDPGSEVFFETGYGFLEGKSNSTYKIVAGFNYYFTERLRNLYAGIGIGYNSSSYISSMRVGHKYYNSSLDLHFLTVPAEIGFALCTKNKRWGITPYGGFDLNIGISGKQKVNDEKSNYKKFGGKLAIDAKLGIRIRLGYLNIGGAYHFPINKKQEKYFGDDAYPEISIGCGF